MKWAYAALDHLEEKEGILEVKTGLWVRTRSLSFRLAFRGSKSQQTRNKKASKENRMT